MKIQFAAFIALLIAITEGRRSSSPSHATVPKKAFGVHNPYCFGLDKDSKHVSIPKEDDEKAVKEVKVVTPKHRVFQKARICYPKTPDYEERRSRHDGTGVISASMTFGPLPQATSKVIIVRSFS